MREALLDTSVLIAAGENDALVSLPEHAAISVVTLGELKAGVLRARTAQLRATREERLVAFRATFEAIPVDAGIAEHYGETLAWARDNRRGGRATDLLIIATARSRGLPLLTLDRAQAGVAAGVGVDLAAPGT